MKSLQTLLLLTLITLYSNGQGSWTQEATFPGIAKGDAFYFSIGNMGYMGAGAEANLSFQNDFWQYDALNNTWTQKASFIGAARWQGVAFSIGSKGYVGVGSGYGLYTDLLEYDPASDSWSQKASFPADARTAAVGFSIAKKGYIGTGYGCSPVPCAEICHNDFWEYDQQTDSWMQKASIPTNGRAFGFGLSIGLKGYIGAGHDDAGNIFNDFWEYNPVTDTWLQKADYPGGPRNDIDGAHFCIGSYGYVGTGSYPGTSNTFDDFWRYDPSINSWTPIPNLPAQSRIGAIGFSINNKGYIGTGYWVSGVLNALTDLWSYTDSTLNPGTGINEIGSDNSIFISQNPFTTQTIILVNNLFKNESLTVYNSLGKQVKQINNISEHTIILNRDNLSSGVYIIHLTHENKIIATRKLIIIDNE